MNLKERKRLQLQVDLDALKTQAQRNKLGQFATPSKLASEVVQVAVEMLQKKERIAFLDPGFGTGSFFSALLSHVPKSRLALAKGFEIDSHYGDHANELWIKDGLDLEIRDFTEVPPTAKYNLVICNPPYVRHHHLGKDKKVSLRIAAQRASDLDVSGLSGLYCYFLILSKAWMTPNGVAAWLIPSEFMDVNYGVSIKQFLMEQVTLERIHRFDPNEAQFDDAIVSSAVVLFRNAPPPKDHKIRFTFGGGLNESTIENEIALNDLHKVAKWTAFPKRSSTKHSKSATTLGELFSIKRGIATGCNSFFMLSEERAKEIPQEFLTPILPSPRELDTDEIKADRNGNPIVSKKLFLLNCDLPEPVVKRDHPSLWKYLQEGIQKGVNEGYLCRHREPWYSQEHRLPPPFLLTYMGRPSSKSKMPFRFILNHSKATAANVYLLLYPKPLLAELLKDKKEVLRSLWQGLTAITEEMFTDEGRIYGGGLHKIEPKELCKVSADLVFAAINNDLSFSRQSLLFE